MDHALLSAAQMRAVEQYMIDNGTSSYALMQRAGKAVAQVVLERFDGRNILVLAGPGNNGGNGFVAAQALLKKVKKLQVALQAELSRLQGNAAQAAADYKGKVISFSDINFDDNPLVIMALYGIGLNRPIEGEEARIIQEIQSRKCDVMAIDIPSGVECDTGEILGIAARARVTVTFGRKKYGHTLLPGRLLCGEIIVADIGLTEEALNSVSATIYENHQGLWRRHLQWPKPEHHKYHRGHTLVIGGAPQKAGAAKLAAIAALRVGSGLVSIVCDDNDMTVYANTALSLLTEKASEWDTLLEDSRKNTVLIGPGAGIEKRTSDLVLQVLRYKKNVVLDADALSVFADNPKTLFSAIESPCILTPHLGEFARIFPAISAEPCSKLQKALKAASLCNAIVVLKGFDTIIAAPDGRAAVNTNAPATLATAGTGDVLAGMCAGLLAQGMKSFEAACAAVWMHGEAAQLKGVGLIAEDISALLPSVLQTLKSNL